MMLPLRTPWTALQASVIHLSAGPQGITWPGAVTPAPADGLARA